MMLRRRTPCARCKKPFGEHSPATHACPWGRRGRTGYTNFHPEDRFVIRIPASVEPPEASVSAPVECSEFQRGALWALYVFKSELDGERENMKHEEFNPAWSGLLQAGANLLQQVEGRVTTDIQRLMVAAEKNWKPK